MQATERKPWEDEIRELCRQGHVSQAVERVVRGYGPEIRRLMTAVLQDEVRVQDAFGFFCESLLKGLPGFRWESSLRTWTQRLARNACFKLVQAAAVRHRHVGLSSVPEQAAGRRSTTNPWQRTTVKERFRVLREKLEPNERRLLELRLDQQLPWPEVVRQMMASGEQLSGEARAQRAAALRQQFQRVKSRLRVLALQEGLIAPDGMPRV